MKVSRFVLSLALTPAVQRTMSFDALRVGDVNRAKSVTLSVAGKGINVGRALSRLGVPARILAFSGGDMGRYMERALGEEGLDITSIGTAGTTRICDTLLDQRTGEVTELVEEASLPSPPEWSAYLEAYRSHLRQADLVILSGALMPGAPADWYGELAALALGANVPLLIDSQKEPLLRVLGQKPVLAKMNRKELSATLGCAVDDVQDVIAGARDLCTRGARAVMVTDGPHGAWLVDADCAWHLCPPKITPVNPIGSGDSVTAGFAAGLLENRAPVESAALGVACGTANALTLLPAHFDAATARAMALSINPIHAKG